SYEAHVHTLAERAAATKNTPEWAAHQVTVGSLGTIHFTSTASSWSALAEREPIEPLARRVLGNTEGTKLLEHLAGCVVSQRHLIGQDRADLSYPPPSSEPTKAMAAVATLRARPGGQDALEEFIRKAAQAIPSLKDPRRFLAYQTVVGDLR